MRAFSDLSGAVVFIADALDRDDRTSLAEACQAPLPADWVIERLLEQHEETPLPQLYEGKEFPENAQRFKLGGHDQELGHIHIDFIKSTNGWEISKIWMCR
jgi:hypothetical protein